MKRILIGLFAILMLFASSTELLAQRKKPTRPATNVKKTVPVQEQSEPEKLSSTQNSTPTQTGESSASLEETLSWLKKALEVGGHILNETILDKYVLKDFNTCTVKLEVHSIQKDLDQALLMEFNLGDLDPISMKIEALDPTSTSLKMQEKNNLLLKNNIGEKKIKTISVATEKGIEIHRGKPFLINEIKLYLKDQETATRIAKAFKHAITLCGGKVDPF